MKHKLIMKQESAKQESMKSTCRLLLVKNAAVYAFPSQSLASEKGVCRSQHTLCRDGLRLLCTYEPTLYARNMFV